MRATMRNMVLTTAAAGFAALAAPSLAFAQASESQPEITLRGDVRLPAAYDPIEFSVPATIAAPASRTERADLDAALRLGDNEGSASAMQWYERFTLAPSEPQILWGEGEAFEMQAGERWGVTLGYSEVEHSPQTFDLEDFSAGAFFELTERLRLGGQLRFTSPEEEVFGSETEDKTPEVRFESAFKF
ncbi:MAG: NtrZ family periplasmic regulatory protein [Oceanicaulis sp.]